MIELAEVIGELRRELQAAINDGEGEQLRFELGPVELEATVALEKVGGGGAKVRFWVIELGGDAKAGEVSTQRASSSPCSLGWPAGAGCGSPAMRSPGSGSADDGPGRRGGRDRP
jgi:hypothetical protein